MFDRIEPTKQIPNDIREAVHIPNLSLDNQIAIGNGRYALPKILFCNKISHESPAAK